MENGSTKTGRRATGRTVYIYGAGAPEVAAKVASDKTPVFTTRTGIRLALHQTGALVRMDKDRRTKKERKRERQERREWSETCPPVAKP